MSTKESASNYDSQMTIKKVVFLGGALLVLAACSDAVGPTSGAQSVDQRAMVRKDSTTVTTTTTATPTAGTITMDECRSGYVIVSGRAECMDQ